jgi:hypothetical protein
MKEARERLAKRVFFYEKKQCISKASFFRRKKAITLNKLININNFNNN